MASEQEAASLAVLKRVALFSSLSEPEFAFLTTHLLQRKYAAGELIFGEGDPCAGLYVVQSGNVRIFKSSAGGREQVLSIDGPGSSIAELPVFDGGAYPASAVAIEETQIAFISQRDFHAYCLEHPQVALKVLSVAGVRLRRLVEIIEELSFTTVRQRLVALLVKLAQTEGAPTGQGIEFQLPSTHQELANQLGTVRELISRNLMRLQAEGLLEVEARPIVVKDMKGLSALLEAAP